MMPGIATRIQQGDAPLCHRIKGGSVAALHRLGPGAVHGDVMARLHSLGGRRNHGISRRDDMGGGAVVFRQPDRFGGIVRFEPSDKVDACGSIQRSFDAGYSAIHHCMRDFGSVTCRNATQDRNQPPFCMQIGYHSAIDPSL
jgi:hypothetical protein